MRTGGVNRLKSCTGIVVPDVLGRIIGLTEGTEVHSWPFEYLPDKVDPEKHAEVLLVITAIDPEDWEDVYDLRFTLGDEPGAMAAVVEVLVEGRREEERLNILYSEGVAISRLREAELNLVVDLRGFAKGKDPQEPIAILDGVLRAAIEEDDAEGCPKHLRRKIRPVNPARYPSPASGQAVYVDGGQSASRPGAQRSKGWRPISLEHKVRVATMNGRKRIRIPRQVIYRLGRAYFGDSGKMQPFQAAIVVADSETKNLSITFSPPEERLVLVEFELKDKSGAIVQAARFLSKLEANLMKADSHIPIRHGLAKWRVIADISKTNPERYRSFRRFRRHLQESTKDGEIGDLVVSARCRSYSSLTWTDFKDFLFESPREWSQRNGY